MLTIIIVVKLFFFGSTECCRQQSYESYIIVGFQLQAPIFAKLLKDQLNDLKSTIPEIYLPRGLF